MRRPLKQLVKRRMADVDRTEALFVAISVLALDLCQDAGECREQMERAYGK